MQPTSKMGFLRRTSSISSLFCFVSAAVCVLILLVLFGDLAKVYKASFAASAFFFFAAGFVLKEIADTDLSKKDLPMAPAHSSD